MPEAKVFAKRLEENEKIILQLKNNIDQMRSAFLEDLSKDDARKGDALLVSLKQQLDLAKDELIRTKEELGASKKMLDDRSSMHDRVSSEKDDLRAELERKSKALLDKDAELNILRNKLTPVIEESRSLARSNANFLKELALLKQQLEEKERLLHDKDSHFNMVLENIRNESQRKLKEAIDMDAKTIIALRNELEKLSSELERRSSLLREREAKEKELMVDVVSRFKSLLSETSRNSSLKDMLPMVDAAIKKGESIDDIKSSLRRSGYNDESIEKAITLIKKGI